MAGVDTEMRPEFDPVHSLKMWLRSKALSIRSLFTRSTPADRLHDLLVGKYVRAIRRPRPYVEFPDSRSQTVLVLAVLHPEFPPGGGPHFTNRALRVKVLAQSGVVKMLLVPDTHKSTKFPIIALEEGTSMRVGSSVCFALVPLSEKQCESDDENVPALAWENPDVAQINLDIAIWHAKQDVAKIQASLATLVSDMARAVGQSRESVVTDLRKLGKQK